VVFFHALCEHGESGEPDLAAIGCVRNCTSPVENVDHTGPIKAAKATRKLDIAALPSIAEAH